MRVFKVKKKIKSKRSPQIQQTTDQRKLQRALTFVNTIENDSAQRKIRFKHNVKQKFGIDLQKTLKSLDKMSKAIMRRPEMMKDAQQADEMLLEAINAKLEILDML